MTRAKTARYITSNRLMYGIAAVIVVAVIGVAFLTTQGQTAGKTSGALRVVAAENFWGSIAAQLGGDRVRVVSIINNPATDPHDYEPTATDSRAVADAQYVLINGAGYDAWAGKLLAVAGTDAQSLNIGELVGVGPGANPHLWYSVDAVQRTIDRITQDYKKLDPSGAAYYDKQNATYKNVRLHRYNELIKELQSYNNTPVGASETIFAPLAQSIGLKLITPWAFMEAISEGTDPSAADVAVANEQITSNQARVYVYNSQNSTPDVARQVQAAKAAGIPVVTITETLTPAGASFQDWQVKQLEALSAALAKGTR